MCVCARARVFVCVCVYVYVRARVFATSTQTCSDKCAKKSPGDLKIFWNTFVQMFFPLLIPSSTHAHAHSQSCTSGC